LSGKNIIKSIREKKFRKRFQKDESYYLAPDDVRIGDFVDGAVLLFYKGVRKNMIPLTAAVVIFLFIYLTVSLVRPEWF
jgi:K+-transporting ATPase KdpF subunit